MNPLSIYNNSPYKLVFKFYMQVGDQKLKHNLE